MEKFEAYRPTSLLELSDTEIADLNQKEQQELIELVLIESKEVIESLAREIDNMDEKFFSLDSFYEIQAVIEEYRQLMAELEIADESFEKCLNDLLNRLEEKNPISEVAKNNHGNVLVHSSDITSLQNLLETKSYVSEVCATAGSLQKKGDIFRPKKKSIHAGIIYNPKQASAWFSKDVGSHRERGKRALESRFEQFRCSSMEEALQRQTGERIEAWVDTQNVQPIALLIIDPDRNDEITRLAKKYNFPILYNSYLYK